MVDIATDEILAHLRRHLDQARITPDACAGSTKAQAEAFCKTIYNHHTKLQIIITDVGPIGRDLGCTLICGWKYQVLFKDYCSQIDGPTTSLDEYALKYLDAAEPCELFIGLGGIDYRVARAFKAAAPMQLSVKHARWVGDLLKATVIYKQVMWGEVAFAAPKPPSIFGASLRYLGLISSPPELTLQERLFAAYAGKSYAEIIAVGGRRYLYLDGGTATLGEPTNPSALLFDGKDVTHWKRFRSITITIGDHNETQLWAWLKFMAESEVFEFLQSFTTQILGDATHIKMIACRRVRDICERRVLDARSIA